ncbi:MAG TPA: glycogen-binding domain-containing protein [Gemmatimonadales bacterium]|nr:glycogen-binding domain-containing protein [Gemmatimonadales bacterium]
MQGRERDPLLEQLLEALDRMDIRLSDDLDRRVMIEVRRLVAVPSGRRSLWSWWATPREIRFALRPWIAAATLAAAAVLVVVLRPHRAVPLATTAHADSAFIRFELYAPGARTVDLAGSFNRWNAVATPLRQVDGSGLWTVTIPLPPGPAQYGFMVDGQRWVPDPAAPSVDDGLGRRNSVVAVPGHGEGRAL